MSLIEEASKVYNENFPSVTCFERAIFISWFCAKPTCKFCYMYTIKDQIKNPRKARRRLSSIFAETLIARILNWKIGFLSAGIASWSTKELEPVLAGMHEIMGEKIWLNLGTLRESQIKALLPHIKGLTGTIETVNWKKRQFIVPDKPIEEIEKMFVLADKYNLKKSITIIIGLGETTDDFPSLADVVNKYKVDRINFYRLVPHEGSLFNKGPSTEYYTEWIAKTRIEFPKLDIVAGSWPNRTDEIPELLRAGANSITKLPAIKYFGRKPAIRIQEGAEKAGRKFESELTEYPKVDINKELEKLSFDEDMKNKIKKKYLKYYRKITSYNSDN